MYDHELKLNIALSRPSTPLRMTASDLHSADPAGGRADDAANSTRTLEDLDRELVYLLDRRLQLLRDHPSAPQPSASLEAAIAETQLPGYVWRSLDTACRAAAVTCQRPPCHATSHHITIIGGRGVMGRFFAQRLTHFGHRIAILGRTDWAQASDIMANTDLVLFCVPIDRTIEIIQQLAPQIPPQAAIADITSIKAPQLQTMLTVHPGPVVGLHPMFGPGVESFLSQKVVVCSGRDRPAWQWFIDLMDADGADLIHCTAEEHDQLMIAVQAIRHFATFGLGIFLAETGIDISRSLDLSSPIYRIGIDMVSRLFGQDAELYVDIMLATPDRQQAIQQLAKTFVRLADRVMLGDREGLIAEFANATVTFGGETERAVYESDQLIEMLSLLLASEAHSAP
jgi:prephenate dehydrogenase/chorismate mutase/prephenate dehydrogenase